MNKAQTALIKAQCIFFASENELKIVSLTDSEFIAQGNGQIVNVPLSHLYTQVQQGWDVIETLQNESCYDEETA